ncbi:MAG: MBL fold metallo-hydrolase [Deltaproteobacteria bacterium]|nr:MBL fold metallo-hydrolase [Deltaproteobacteria bacterium]
MTQASADRSFGRVTVLLGANNGKYPHGNSVLVRGRDARLIIDPSLAVAARAKELRGAAEVMVVSHAHEDHIAGVFVFPEAEVFAHREDAIGMRSVEGLMAIYGYGAELTPGMRDYVIDHFHYCARPDTQEFDDSAVFELGGVRVRAFHLPGHTRGHCAFLIEPEGVLFLGDIDLSGFGPYYGDAWSSVDDFARSLERVRAIEARVWVSAHHVGVIEDPAVYEKRLAAFTAKITERDQAIVEFLREPHTLAEMVRRRFLYPPQAELPFIDMAEQHTIEQHLRRLAAAGAVVEMEPGVFRHSSGVPTPPPARTGPR